MIISFLAVFFIGVIIGAAVVGRWAIKANEDLYREVIYLRSEVRRMLELL